MTICFYKEQGKLFHQFIKSCEVDMNYKHLIRKDEHEILWAWFNPVQKKCKCILIYDRPLIDNWLIAKRFIAIVLIRVLTNKDSQEMYKQMFTRVFMALRKVNSQPITFKHLSNKEDGFIGLTVDQDSKLFTGILLLPPA